MQFASGIIALTPSPFASREPLPQETENYVALLVPVIPGVQLPVFARAGRPGYAMALMTLPW